MTDYKRLLYCDGLDNISIQTINYSLDDYFPHINLTNNKKIADIVINFNNLDSFPLKIGVILDFIEEKIQNIDNLKDLSYKNYSLNIENSCLLIKDQTIDLNNREIQLLSLLMRAEDKGCHRDSLLKTIWGYRPDLETHAVETQIYRLRQKIEQETGFDNIIVTIDGGYKLA